MCGPLLGNNHTTQRTFTSLANCGNGDGDDYDDDDHDMIIVVPNAQSESTHFPRVH